MSPATRRDRKPTICGCLGSRLYRWRATLALLVGCAALLWHLLACVESPMAFSPNGDLAFTVMRPLEAAGDDDDVNSPGDQGTVGRLFVLPKDEKTLRLIEETQDHVLCAPSYSPDGKTLCYLRAPQRIERPGEKPDQQGDESADDSSPALVSSEGYQFEDLTLPAVSELAEFLADIRDAPRAEVTLVVRDAASGEVRSTTQLNLPVPEANDEEGALWLLLWMYSLGKTKHSPDGQWIYVCAGRLLLAVNPEATQVRLLAAPVWSSALSPDGALMATATEAAIGLIETDGKRTLFRRLDEGPSLASPKGLAWLDNDTLVALTEQGEGRPLSLALVRRDGTIARSIELPINDVDDSWEELAISPDGKRVAIATKTALYLLDADGKVVSQWEEQGISTCSPTFSPDSKRLACKLVPEEDDSRSMPIAFFSPGGEELFRIDVPQDPEK